MKSLCIIAVFLTTVTTLSACSSNQTNKVSKISSTSISTTKKSSTSKSSSKTEKVVSSESSSQTLESSSAQETSPAPQTQQETIWNTGKNQQLSEFMDSWGREMNQTYAQYSPTHNLNLYGLALPFSVLENHSVWKAAIDNNPINLVWSETGEDMGDYLLVAVYSDVADPKASLHHVYFFVLKDGCPLVLYTAQNQGNENNYLYLKETANNELRNAFTRIIG